MPKTQIVCDNSLYFDLYQSPASGSGLEINPAPISLFSGPFDGIMRQLCQTRGYLLQFPPICYHNFIRKLGKNLERAEIRPTFASEIRNDIAL